MNNKSIIALSGLAAAIIVIFFSRFGTNLDARMSRSMAPAQTVKTQTSGDYLDFSEEILKAEQAKGNKIVLFFRAGWCPVCYEIDKEFHDRAQDIPKGVTILKVDYVSTANDELKKKYNVTYQHTFIEIDKDGAILNRWLGGGVDTLKEQLK